MGMRQGVAPPSYNQALTDSSRFRLDLVKTFNYLPCDQKIMFTKCILMLKLFQQRSKPTQRTQSPKRTQPSQKPSPIVSRESKTSHGTGEKIEAVSRTATEIEELPERGEPCGC